MGNKKKKLNARKRKTKELQQKRRYLKNTGFQLETVKWLFISFVLVIFGAAKYIKYSLLLLLVWDLFQTEYLFSIKWSRYFKYLVNALVIFLFILNLKMFIFRNVVEAIIVIVLIYIFNEKYMKNYNQFKDMECDEDEE
jgi:hypothetical protein